MYTIRKLNMEWTKKHSYTHTIKKIETKSRRLAPSEERIATKNHHHHQQQWPHLHLWIFLNAWVGFSQWSNFCLFFLSFFCSLEMGKKNSNWFDMRFVWMALDITRNVRFFVISLSTSFSFLNSFLFPQSKESSTCVKSTICMYIFTVLLSIFAFLFQFISFVFVYFEDSHFSITCHFDFCSKKKIIKNFFTLEIFALRELFIAEKKIK